MRSFSTRLLLLLMVLPGSAFAGKSGPDSFGSDPKKGEAKADGGEKDKKKDKPFAEVIEDHQRIHGLFTFYRNDTEGTVYMEIQPGQVGPMFLCAVTRTAGDGSYYDSASQMYEFPFVLERVGKKIHLLHKNVYYRASPDTAIGRAVDRGVSDSIFGVGEIVAAPHPDSGALLIKPDGMFLQDVGWVEASFSERKSGSKYRFDDKESYFGTLASYPANSEVEVVLHFKSSNPTDSPATIPDPRSFRHVYHYSLAAIPQTDYRPRLADDRVGHFLTMYQDYSSVLSDTPYVRYINRWHLAKAEPRFAQSPPREPIVFWMENTIPVEYRPAVRRGIELWNRAFAAIGFDDAIVVRQQPDDADWDAGDVRYTTVRWMVQPGAGYAVGPSRTNPMTGQIYDADIRISADMIRYVMLSYEELAAPVAQGFRDLRPGRSATLGQCDHAEGLMEQAAFGMGVLAARGMDPLSPAGQQYIEDYLVGLVAHEVGHTLGLRHNFKGTQLHPTSGLHTDQAAERGLSSSVMDYTPVNIAPEGRPQGAYWQTNLGPYDYWAIEYAYRPLEADSADGERAELERIAARGSEPALAYGTDEDAFDGPRGIDPSCTRWDLGQDGIEFHRRQVGLAKELWSKLESEFETPGQRYTTLRRVFARALRNYRGGVGNVTKHIGGVYTSRAHVGDPNGRPPLVPVPAARQREALQFLAEQVFGRDNFAFDPALLAKLAPERLLDFEGSAWSLQRIDYPLHNEVLALQRRALDHLYDGLTLARLLDNEQRFARDETPFTMADLFGQLRQAIWLEVGERSNVNSFRRELQRAHMQSLLQLVVKPDDDAPADATSLARMELARLDGEMGQALAATLDLPTRAHLEESRALIGAGLQAGIERQLVK